MRVFHYSIRTEEAYIQWIKRFIFFHNKRHPNEMGEKEIRSFLTHLDVDKHVSASTQNQALSAILFLYKRVLEVDLDWIDDVVRAKRPKRLPVVLSKGEVNKILNAITGVNGLQELPGHKDISTTMIYIHVLNKGGRGVRSPLDV